MKKYKLTINQRIINDSADEWTEIYDTYEQANIRLAEIKKKNRQYDPNYSIIVTNGIEAVD